MKIKINSSKLLRSAQIWALLFLTSFLVFAQEFEPVPAKPNQVYINPYLENSTITSEQAIKDWAWTRSSAPNNPSQKIMNVPAETGRAFMMPVKDASGKEILIKGTGPNPEWIGDRNKIRYSVDATKKLGFDGKFKASESLIDIYNSELARSLGMDVARPLGFINTGYDAALKTDGALYARSFVSQTRLSNLSAMSKEEGLAKIDETIETLHRMGTTHKKLSRTEYFFWLSDRLAKNAAIMQSSGLQHGVLHSQQISLAGEFTDFGTSTWKHDPEFNKWFKKTPVEYYKFENQPLLIQNMLTRSHTLTSDKPIPLGADSETLKYQRKSLLGFFMEADPETAKEISANDPFRRYWDQFENHYQDFKIDQKTLPKLSEHFKYDKPGDVMTHWPAHYMKKSDKVVSLNIGSTTQGPLVKPRDYFTDDMIIKKGIQATYTQSPVKNSVPVKVVKQSVSSDYWGLKIDMNDPKLQHFIKQFDNEVEAILKANGDLAHPDSIRSLLRLMRDESSLQFGPQLTGQAKADYLALNKKRFGGEGIKFSDLAECKIGQCMDNSMLSFLMGKSIEKKDPRFTFSMMKMEYGGGRKHFNTLMKAPNEKVYVIDSQASSARKMGTYEDMMNKSYYESFHASLTYPKSLAEPYAPVSAKVDAQIFKNVKTSPKGRNCLGRLGLALRSLW